MKSLSNFNMIEKNLKQQLSMEETRQKTEVKLKMEVDVSSLGITICGGAIISKHHVLTAASVFSRIIVGPVSS